MHIVSEPEIEAELLAIQNSPAFPAVKADYDRLLNKLGNVEGDEIIALVILASSGRLAPSNVSSNEQRLA